MDNRASATTGVATELESIALVALDSGRLLMEAGASASRVEEIVNRVARGLGAEHVDLRIEYASLAITIRVGQLAITRMRSVGHLGVNQRLAQRLWKFATRVSARELSTKQTFLELADITTKTPAHNQWVTALAVGAACAAFGRLLGADWSGTGPVFLASSVGQSMRRSLSIRRMNVYISTAIISFSASLICSLGLRLAGSKTATLAVISSILFLVPGVPAMNAQNDILEGYPTLGSARALTAMMTLIFIAVGIWVGPVISNLWR